MDRIDEGEARLRASVIAREIASGGIAEFAGAMRIWKEVIDRMGPKCPEDLWPFKSNASAIEDIRWNAGQGGSPNTELIRQCEREIMAAARKLAGRA